MITAAAEHAVNLAQLTATSLDPLKAIILPIIGAVLLIVLAARMVGAFAEEKYGRLPMLIIAAVPVAMACYFPDATLSILKGLAQILVGS
jgi:hypothetical protein